MGTVRLQQLGGEPVHILLVEDEPFLRMDVAKALRRAGFQVIEAPDADAAMEFIDSGDQIDLVFTDVWTPGVLNGLALAERVQAKFPMMPVIITSSNAKVGDAASRLGRFVPKPYEPTRVANMIAQIVGSSLQQKNGSSDCFW
jgi:two-component system, response regulator PdtaR